MPHHTARPPVKLAVEKLAAGGEGLARLNGEIILTPRALPGELVSAVIGPARKGVRRADVEKIILPSPLRTNPDCPLAASGRCDGCDFIHVRPEAALKLKSEAALGRLAETYGLETKLIESPLAAHYRHRLTLHLGLADGGLTAGFFDQRRQAAEFADCRLAAPALNRAAEALRLWAAQLPQAMAGPEIHLALGDDGAGLLAVFRPSPGRPAGAAGRSGRNRAAAEPALPHGLAREAEKLPAILAAHGFEAFGVFIQTRRHAAPRPLALTGQPGAENGRPLEGNSSLKLIRAAAWPELGLTLRAGPGVFTQVNPAVNKLMVELILELAAPLASARAPSTPARTRSRPARALDLYCGLGNISLPLAKKGFAVTGVESSADSLAAARLNAEGGAAFMRGDGAALAAALVKQGQSFDLIVLDPPRAGARDLAPHLAAMKPELIVYVACRPAALARDLPAFVSLGYRPISLTALDMFPRTSHFETVAALVRA
ncbi:MAG: methyltransferase domain-containing protein [Candidatus Adiutrix sp.]|nr:methyltransferase domain-containing protein [Candidatus Adiutrix sp.]